MMSEPKPFASLSSGLLARKGQAKPAMRPQGFSAGFGMAALQQDDLGWNDMGHDLHPVPTPAAPIPVSADIVPIQPVAAPEVVRQQEELERELSAPMAESAPQVIAIEPQPVVETLMPVVETSMPVVEAPMPVAEVPHIAVKMPTAPKVQPARSRTPRAAPGSKAKAAFTLRLDPERHLKLRLVCAVEHRSAQAVVAAALDAYLAQQPAAQLAGTTNAQAR